MSSALHTPASVSATRCVAVRVDDAARLGRRRRRCAGAAPASCWRGRRRSAAPCASTSRQPRRVERAQAGVGGRDQEAAVAQPHADVARAGVHVAALVQRRADAADLVAQAGFVAHAATARRPWLKKSLLPKLPDFSARCRPCAAARRGRVAPRHAGVDLRTDAQLRDAQRLHARARGLAAGHDQLAHAALAPGPRRCATSACSTSAPARATPSCCLHRLHRVRRRGGVDQQRPVRPAAAAPRPAPRRPRRRPAAERQRVDRQASAGRLR